MVPVNQNLDGANFFAPSLNNNEAISFQPRNVTGALGLPLLIIGVGKFGELVLKEFKEFTRYHRSGFSWSPERMARFAIVQGNEIYEEVDDLTRISFDRFPDVAWGMYQFLRTSDKARCVITANLSDRDSFKLVENMLGDICLWNSQGSITPPELLLCANQQNNLGPQSARVRQISIWQEYGRQLEHNPENVQMVSRAFFVSQEPTEDFTIKKMALSLFTLYHEDQPLALQLQGSKNIAVNFKAIDVPFKELIELQAIALTRKLLLGDDNFFNLEPRSLETVNELARNPDVLNKWQLLKQMSDLDAARLLNQFLNEKNLTSKWPKLYLLSAWLIQKGYNQFNSLINFIKNSNSHAIQLSNITEKQRTEIADELKNDTNHPLLRWSSQNPDEDALSFLGDFFPDQQLNDIQARIGSRCGFVMRESDLKPFIFFIPLPFDGNDRINDHLYLSDGENSQSVEQLFFDCYSDIKYLLEEKFVQNQSSINAKFLFIDKDTSAFLMDVPELIPGRTQDSWALISHSTLNMSDASNQLRAAHADAGRISEPGLAILTSIEPDVHFLNFPSPNGYLSKDTDDERLKNAVDLEKSLNGKVLHEFSTSILRYLGNTRAVRLFFEAYRKGLITFDVDKGWQVKFLAQTFYDRNIRQNPPYDKNIESLVYIFKQFCLDGHSLPMFNSFFQDNFVNLLDQLETEMMNLEPIPEIDKWFENKCLNTQGESADICFLYKKINRI